ncbi:hypothetical protein ACFU9B_23275 [Streptomyces sp. NPDC057592]|uniref:hypothetical protein n=1 Tax=unclassified Streptomyces TaxID=2593676 RepID=UPI00367B18FE
MTQLLTAGVSLVLIGGWGLGAVALALLVIGLTAICRVESKDIPEALRALADWLPWGIKSRRRR